MTAAAARTCVGDLVQAARADPRARPGRRPASPRPSDAGSPASASTTYSGRPSEAAVRVDRARRSSGTGHRAAARVAMADRSSRPSSMTRTPGSRGDPSAIGPAVGPRSSGRQVSSRVMTPSLQATGQVGDRLAGSRRRAHWRSSNQMSPGVGPGDEGRSRPSAIAATSRAWAPGPSRAGRRLRRRGRCQGGAARARRARSRVAGGDPGLDVGQRPGRPERLDDLAVGDGPLVGMCSCDEHGTSTGVGTAAATAPPSAVLPIPASPRTTTTVPSPCAAWACAAITAAMSAPLPTMGDATLGGSVSPSARSGPGGLAPVCLASVLSRIASYRAVVAGSGATPELALQYGHAWRYCRSAAGRSPVGAWRSMSRT